jgi:hypothetical protein
MGATRARSGTGIELTTLARDRPSDAVRPLMIFQVIFAGMSLAVLVSMVVFQLLGRRFATRRGAPGEGPSGTGVAAIEASVFALLGLLVAFSFSGSETRLQARRELIVKEVDAVGTAYLRLDLLPAAYRDAIKEPFRRYVDTRVAYYEKLRDSAAASLQKSRGEELQREIWTLAVGASQRAPDMRASLIVLPALNEMFDVATERDATIRIHIPVAVFLFLGILACGCAFLVGIDMAPPARESWLHVFLFAATMGLTAYVVLNLEYPLAGFVRLGQLEGLLAQLRATM